MPPTVPWNRGSHALVNAGFASCVKAVTIIRLFLKERKVLRKYYLFFVAERIHGAPVVSCRMK
jgi:hypothetical protein